MDPVVVALGGVVSTLAAVIFRAMEQRAKRAEDAEVFWRDKALTSMGLAQMAVDVAEAKK